MGPANRPRTRIERLDRAAGPVVRRSWQLLAEPQGPLLAGLFGFPWQEPLLDARCTRTQGAGPADLFGTVRVGRLHRSVPSPDCTCGIYATEEPHTGWLQRRYLRDKVLVSGFVRLSGKLVFDGSVVRAERAEIVGPLTIALPQPHWLRRLGARAGISQTVRRIVRDGTRYAVRYSTGTAGMPLGEWHRQMSEQLRRRYGVAVIGLVPPLPGLLGGQ